MEGLRPRGVSGAGVGVTMNRNYWLDTATKEIRFGPDRRRVRQELEDHILDRMEVVQSRGLSAYEAEKVAVESMGDPERLARELGALHRPWMGYLWRLSQVLLVVLVLCIAANWTYFRDLWNSGPDWAPPEPPPNSTYVWQDLSLGELGGYQFTAPLLFWEQWDDGTWGGTLILQGASWQFWEKWNAYGSILEVRDNRGISYYNRTRAGGGTAEGIPQFYYNQVQDSYTSVTVEIRFDYMPDPEDLQWLEITIGDETLTISLEGGGAA